MIVPQAAAGNGGPGPGESDQGHRSRRVTNRSEIGPYMWGQEA
jgi:hypothetical protein